MIVLSTPQIKSCLYTRVSTVSGAVISNTSGRPHTAFSKVHRLQRWPYIKAVLAQHLVGYWDTP